MHLISILRRNLIYWTGWAFKVKNKHIPLFTDAFKTAMETIEFPGFVGLARSLMDWSNGGKFNYLRNL